MIFYSSFYCGTIVISLVGQIHRVIGLISCLASDLSRVWDTDGGGVGGRVPAAQLPAAQDVLLPRRPAPRARMAQTPRGEKLWYRYVKKESRRIGCVIPRCILQYVITQPILRLF